MARACGTCRFCHPAPNEANPTLGWCRWKPPQLSATPDGRLTSSFPPVNTVEMLCGAYQRKPLLWRLLGRTG